MKRIVIISDLHCGHRVGLTPPVWQYQLNPDNERWDKFAHIQRELWDFYAGKMAELQPIDVLVVNGDAIDGKGSRAGGTETVDENRINQVDMAVRCIAEAKAKQVIMTYGTAYHSGDEEDWEDLVARDAQVQAKIGGHEWIDVNGLIFDLKHHIGGSQIPHGRHTAAAREALWNQMWAEHQEQPKADVIIRSHVHYHAYCGQAGVLCVITPALQGFGSKYGTRRCSGTVDIGMICFDVESKHKFDWWDEMAHFKSMKAQVTKI